MRRRLIAAAVTLAALVLALAGYLAYRLRSLDTPEATAALLQRASAALGTQVRARELEVSLLRGVGLRQVTVANPSGFSGELLSADAFRLRYDLLPLLRGRVQVDELALERPVLRLAMDARGVFNYERLGGPTRQPASTPAALPRLPIALSLSGVSLKDGQVSVVDHLRTPLLTLDDLDLDSSFALASGELRGRGEAKLGTLGLAGRLFLRRVSAPLELTKHKARLAPIRGTLADGAASGALELDLASGFRYKLSLEVDGARVDRLLEEAGGRGLSGSLLAKASFEGSGGLPTVAGRGSARVDDCQVRGSKVLSMLAATLQLSELAAPDFDDCRAEFTLARGRAETTLLNLKGPAVQLTGRGTSNLLTRALDYDMTLALSQTLLGRIPVKEMRAAFRDRGDSFSTLDFKVSGTTDAPRTDIASRIAKAGAVEALKGALGKLFRKNPR
jgi:uncharacterized protein involved in outer membrane biogenesis